MAQAPRDQNFVTTLLGTSSVDGTTPVVLWADPTTHRLLVDNANTGSSLVVGTTTITGGSNGRILYDNAGVLGEYPIGTGVATALGTNVGSAGAFVVNGGALGTPSSGVATNLTGTASGLTAGTVTTNANLTGVITSVGNATSTGSQTGTGNTFVMSVAPTITGHPTLEGVTSTGATGTGNLVFSNSPTFVTPALGTPASGVATNLTGTASGLTAGNVTTNANLTGVITSVGNATSIASQTGTGTKFVVDTSPTLVTPNIGVATATTVNKVTITAPATSATLTIADGKTVTHNSTTTFAGTDGKTLTVNKSLTLDGTDSTTMTFPSTSATIARTDAAQTFTGTQTFSQVITTNNAITASSNAATVPVTSKLNTVTNNSAATLTITLTTTSAVDGQSCIVRVLDSSAVAQTITWVNTENSTVSVPTTSNGSTTLPLTVGFMYNNATSKWRCIASS